MYVFPDTCESRAHPRETEQRERPVEQEPDEYFPSRKPRFPRAQERINFKAVAHILEAFNATKLFGKNRLSNTRTAALKLFSQACKKKGLPLELRDEQLKAYLDIIYAKHYTVNTINARWKPITDIMEHNNMQVSDRIQTLYEKNCGAAKERRDTKLPVAASLLKEQIEAVDKLWEKGYENSLAKAALATAWVAQLRVSEYTSTIANDEEAGVSDHNLRSNHILLSDKGMTFILLTDKTGVMRKERFVAWEKCGFDQYKDIMMEYDAVRMKKSPVFFCHADGSNLTPNHVRDWIDLTTMHTRWAGLKITSHCYRIGGTSFQYAEGKDIINIQRAGRWSTNHSDAVEFYLKPGLYVTEPDQIKEKLPQYKMKYSKQRMRFLQDRITTPGGKDHVHNQVLKQMGFKKLRTSYPTKNKVLYASRFEAVKKARSYMYKVKVFRCRVAREKRARKALANSVRFQTRKSNACWVKAAQLALQQERKCAECDTAAHAAQLATAKCESLAGELQNKDAIITQLEKDKADVTFELESLTSEYAKLRSELEEVKAMTPTVTVLKPAAMSTLIHELQEELDVPVELDVPLVADGETAPPATASTSSAPTSSPERVVTLNHRKTRTLLPGEKIDAFGRILMPSNNVVQELAAIRNMQTTEKYVDENGEARKSRVVKLKNNMLQGIRKRYSRRFRFYRTFQTSGKRNKLFWVVPPRQAVYTRSTRARVYQTYYNCVKYGPAHWPETDDELDGETTDEEELTKIEMEGFSDHPSDYVMIKPDPAVWDPFMANLKHKPRIHSSKVLKCYLDVKGQLDCANRVLKKSMAQELLEACQQRQRDVIAGEPAAVEEPISNSEINLLVDSLRPTKIKKTKRAKHKKRVPPLPPLRPDLGWQRVDGPKIPRKEISARKRLEEARKASNKTKEWVTVEGQDYMASHVTISVPVESEADEAEGEVHISDTDSDSE